MLNDHTAPPPPQCVQPLYTNKELAGAWGEVREPSSHLGRTPGLVFLSVKDLSSSVSLSGQFVTRFQLRASA